MIKAALIACLPLAVQAGGWEAFQARCLAPFEAAFVPYLDGLKILKNKENTTIYSLAGGDILIYDVAPQDGLSACQVVSAADSAEAAFDDWIAGAVRRGRYRVSDNPEGWVSNGWAEPVLALQKRRQNGKIILRMLETDLES